MFDMATSAYLSQGGPPPNTSDQEDGVMNLVNPAVSQGYSLPREQVVGFSSVSPTRALPGLLIDMLSTSKTPHYDVVIGPIIYTPASG